MGIYKVVAIFYLTVALAVGLTHDVRTNSGHPIAESIGAGLIWPWFVIEFVIEAG